MRCEKKETSVENGGKIEKSGKARDFEKLTFIIECKA
jgi:hypothetical protein